MSFKLIKCVQKLQPQTNKYIEMMKVFDGSVTKLIQSLSAQQVKVTKFHQNLNYQHNQLTLSPPPLNLVLDRVVLLSRPKQEHNPFCIGRSLWDRQAYNNIMKEGEDRAIGINLINKRVEMFKQIKWFGYGEFELNGRRWTNVPCRSQIFWSKGMEMLYLEEYFFEQFFNLFQDERMGAL